MTAFTWPVRVYYEDTDCGGVIYHTGYLRFMERARTEWLRSFNIEQDQLLTENILFAVQKMEVRFLTPGRFNDKLLVTVDVIARGRASLQFKQSITDAAARTKLCEATVKVACLSADSFRPCKIPAKLNKEIFGDH